MSMLQHLLPPTQLLLYKMNIEFLANTMGTKSHGTHSDTACPCSLWNRLQPTHHRTTATEERKAWSKLGSFLQGTLL